MLNFKSTSFFFISLLLLLLVYDAVYAFYTFSTWFYVIPILLYGGIVSYGCYFIEANFFFKSICEAQTDERVIAITFDDGPIADRTPEILQILKSHAVQAAFFCIGKNIKENKSLLQQIHDEGHVIGNHSYSHHFLFDIFSTKRVRADLQQMDEAVHHVIGKKPLLFRPPYGVTNPNIQRAIKGNYKSIGWNVRSMDTVVKDNEQLLAKIKAATKPGAIFLFHDSSKTTSAILPEFIEWVKQNGYKITRLDKMLNLNPYA